MVVYYEASFRRVCSSFLTSPFSSEGLVCALPRGFYDIDTKARLRSVFFIT